MAMCKTNDWWSDQKSIKVPNIYCKQKSRFIYAVQKKALKDLL